MRTMQEKIDLAASWIAGADSLVVTAGAGMGVDSGLPDFRGNEGFWRAYPALARGKIGFEEIANQAAFEATPRLAWGFYGHRLDLYRRTVPHRGFAILQEFGARMANRSFVFTSNVDGQFQKAGFDPSRIEECHGSIRHLQCLTPCTARIWPADDLAVEVDDRTGMLVSPLPACPHCGGLARPNILLFNDWSWVAARTEMQRHRFDKWLRSAGTTVVIEVGAGTAIPSVRRKSQALRAPLIRINPTVVQADDAQFIGFQAGALETLEQIKAALT